MKKFVVAEPTEDMCGVELVEEDGFAVLKDFNSEFPREDYLIHFEDISKLIEGLKMFLEVKE
jgi:hypothetical protein